MPDIGGSGGTGGGGTGGTDAGALHSIQNLADLSNFLAAKANLGIPVINPKMDFGAHADGVTADDAMIQQAINYAAGQRGGGVIYMPDKYALANPLQLKTGVYLVMGVNNRQTGLGLAQGGQLVPSASFPSNAWLIDSPSAALYNCGVMGGSIAAPPPTSTSSPRWGGIRVQNGNYVLIGGVSIGGMSLQPVYVVNGVGCQIENLGLQQITKYRTLTTWEGALDIGGTDHTMRHCQCNGGDNSAVYDAVNYYRNGFLLRGQACWVYDVNGEYSDCGWTIIGKDNRCYGIRGDVNAGRGGSIIGVLNQLYGTLLYANANDAVLSGVRGAHDGIFLGPAALGNTIDGVVADTLSAPITSGPFAGQTLTLTSRYIVNDTSNGGNNPRLFGDGVNRIRNVDAPLGTYEIEKIGLSATAVYGAIETPHASDPQFRRQSRYCSGATAADTTNHRSAYSDGQYWRDSDTNLIVGNRMLPNSSVPLEGNDWAAYNSTGTLSTINGEGESANKAASLFFVPKAWKLAATAAGVTAGGMGAISTVLPVEAGNSYVFLTHARGRSKAFTVTPTVTWYDAAHITGTGSGISSQTLVGGSVPIGSPVKVAWSLGAAPAGAVVCRILLVFAATGLAANDIAEFSLNCLVLTQDVANGVSYASSDYVHP